MLGGACEVESEGGGGGCEVVLALENLVPSLNYPMPSPPLRLISMSMSSCGGFILTGIRTSARKDGWKFVRPADQHEKKRQKKTKEGR